MQSKGEFSDNLGLNGVISSSYFSDSLTYENSKGRKGRTTQPEEKKGRKDRSCHDILDPPPKCTQSQKKKEGGHDHGSILGTL